MELSTERLSIVELSFHDLSDIHQLHSLKETDEFNTLGIPDSIQVTESLLNEWINQQKANPRVAYLFRVQLKKTNQFVGLIALTLGKLNFRIAEVWYKTLPDYWCQGYTTEALKELIRYGFSSLELHRIEAGCAVGNKASMKVLEKVGMVREGCKRKILPIRGEWVDAYFYSILETDQTV
ncbi:GNAT family N-acetyltransferase [Larkinella terrae]|uniref:GNAT family N-acetyltransferase n=1 Tax=Larkinella terrae TaxID=2025311 RepID=A0A7K0EEL1_9BACT|nr:GNAT family protein [Larkinella terrae]MRS60257.1 GNAT family N-acetyltransferase [Larkinella terrae]